MQGLDNEFCIIVFLQSNAWCRFPNIGRDFTRPCSRRIWLLQQYFNGEPLVRLQIITIWFALISWTVLSMNSPLSLWVLTVHRMRAIHIVVICNLDLERCECWRRKRRQHWQCEPFTMRDSTMDNKETFECTSSNSLLPLCPDIICHHSHTTSHAPAATCPCCCWNLQTVDCLICVDEFRDSWRFYLLQRNRRIFHNFNILHFTWGCHEFDRCRIFILKCTKTQSHSLYWFCSVYSDGME